MLRPIEPGDSVIQITISPNADGTYNQHVDYAGLQGGWAQVMLLLLQLLREPIAGKALAQAQQSGREQAQTPMLFMPSDKPQSLD